MYQYWIYKPTGQVVAVLIEDGVVVSVSGTLERDEAKREELPYHHYHHLRTPIAVSETRDYDLYEEEAPWR